MADDLTPEQVKAFRLADNKTGELAEWDMEKLDIELEGIDAIDFEFDLPLPNGRSYKRNGDVKKALGLE